jgi:hypothetical protein
MNNDVAVYDSEESLAIQQVIDECQISELSAKKQVAQALIMAKGVNRLREIITDEFMHDVMALQGTSLGFRTDKDRNGGYDIATVKDVFIEATIRGFRMVGNEVNIIAGRFYGTKEGYSRLVSNYPGLTDLQLMPGVPKTQQGGAIVPFRSTWKLNGEQRELSRDIPCKGDKYSGADQYIGKATRKMLASIYSVLQGTGIDAAPDGSVDDIGTTKPARVTGNQNASADIDSLNAVTETPSSKELF